MGMVFKPEVGAWSDVQARKDVQREIVEKRKKFDAQIEDIKLQVIKEIAEKRKIARKKLSEELRNARTNLQKINWQIHNAQIVAEKALRNERGEIRRSWSLKLRSARKRYQILNEAYSQFSERWFDKVSSLTDLTITEKLYPPVPDPMISPSDDGAGIPSAPGIYFLWLNDVVEYVGQSVKLNSRVRVKSHHILTYDHKISFVFIDNQSLTYAECFYIGLLRPKRNYGTPGKGPYDR